MPKAEVGSTKYVGNKMKAKGLQRLRWYCQICEKQCRDENGFKQHTQSEGHVRAMLMVGEDPKKFINDYSRQFQRDFIQLLRTAHGEKKVHMNNFYQEYIRDKEHIHMNATKWPSMTEFAKHLGREGICRVEEGDRGLEISWIDDSSEAIRRKEDIRKKESLMKGDEDMESRLLAQQIKRAKQEAAAKAMLKPVETPLPNEGDAESAVPLEPVKVSVSLKAKGPAKPTTSEAPAEDAPVAIYTFSTVEQPAEKPVADDAQELQPPAEQEAEKPAAPVKMSLSLGKKAANPLAKKNPFAKKKEAFAPEPEKKMSNAERIMKEELERKRAAEERGQGGAKRPRFN